MPLRSPNLDDRRFNELVEEARRRITQSCPQWTDLSPGDPGMALVEVFAYLTEAMIYRLNRLPEKAYVEFLRLIGVQLQPPAAAMVTLRFTLSRVPDHPVPIPRGTRVTTARTDGGAESPVFTTAETVTIEAGSREVEVTAYHCDTVTAELAGTGTAQPGLSVTAARPPVVAPTPDGLDLWVGVEEPEGIELRGPAVRHEGKTYRIWREVRNFTNLGTDRHVYVADRLTGTINFAPALRIRGEDGNLDETPKALADIPAAGREIRLWYRRGGGLQGNVSADMLTVLKDPIPGIQVTNPCPAVGGRSAEPLDNALLRGPQELHSLQRAVTARDFELLAIRSSGAVERARAFTRAMLWAHAQPGTVEILLVPALAEAARSTGRVSADTLRQQQTDAVREQIQRALDERRPLGTTCLVNWARYKTVRVRARLIVYREEDPAAVRERLLGQLYRVINPLPTAERSSGWPFGQPLTAFMVNKIIASEPGVKTVDRIHLLVDAVPENNVYALDADAFQAGTWYAGAGDTVFRSMNNGQGWEPIGRFPGEEIERVKAYPREAGTRPGRAGLLAVATALPDPAGGSRVYLSRDCGETWEPGPQTRFRIEDMAWLDRDGVPSLLLATELGLYELAGHEGAVPVQVLVDPSNQDLGFYAVAVSTDVWGETSVAVAARGDYGIYLSSTAGKPRTFESIGLKGQLVRVLAVQHLGPHRYLWTGLAAPGTAPGQGCFRWRLTGSTESPEGWRGYHKNWQAGGCRALAFQGSTVLAASLRLGVLRLDLDSRDPQWEPPDINCGLPLRDVGRLQPVDTVATDPQGRLLLAGGIAGVFRSKDGGARYEYCSMKELADEVTLPQTWLFCSGEHEIEVLSEDEARRD